ncbi:MAG: RdgB/HAM1 family non-canonical purine NTP pyrophosphatase [Pseudomonadota bacterium]
MTRDPADGRRLQPGCRLVVATHNPGKLREINDLVRPFALDAVSAGELGLPEPEETGLTFVANADLKARAAALASGLPALADDSGLEVADLGGAPGIYSARWAGPDKDFAHAMEKVAKELKSRHAWRAPGPVANFTCALSLVWPDGTARTFEGKVFGRLVWPLRGTRGFGYDPMFVPDGHDATFGEMEPAAKHAMSHRAVAFAQFVDACMPAKPAATPGEQSG